MRCKVAIFDMDGTVLNTIDDLAASANYLCKKYGYPLHSVEEYYFMVGNGIPKLVERFLPSDVSDEIRTKVLEEYIEYYGEHSADKTRPYDGIVELLRALREKGVKIALNTNKVESAATKLCNDYFPMLFDIICGNRKNLAVKPSPDGVYEIFKKAGISKEDAKNGAAVYIGDSDVDVQTGLNAGIEVIAVDWGFRGKEFLENHGAKHIAMTPKDVFDFIIKP